MLVGGGNIGAGLARRLKKITALNSSNVISSALPNWRKVTEYDRLFW